ncbi:hypothetical protein [uncultured Microscilla sp.]|uniref:hypothetical protein n=1 Tax=uncultured Microscilla sp. TaxID=432653 RepID=UPI002631462A|nr:hypothetical protein [uncultured Microscilla sp.]
MKAVIGVPGYWKSHEEIPKLIAACNDNFICAGSTLINTKTQAFFELEVYDHDPDLKISYAYCGRKTFTDEDIQAVDKHTCTVYIIGEAGTPAFASELLKAGGALLNAGGIAVKIESSGVAHLKKDWQRLIENNELIDLYRAFVTIVKDHHFYLSYGMQVIGYPEGQVFFIGDNGVNDGQLQVLDVFLVSLLMDDLQLANDHTFALTTEKPKYVLKHVYYDKYPEDDLFFNPHGVWQLTKQK